MNVISFMNVSNGDNIATDSGFKFYNILATEFLAAGINFTFVGPVALDLPTAGYHHMRYGDNKYEYRFLFDMDRIEDIVRAKDPDIIIVNQIELIPQFCICLEKIGNVKAKVVGYVHYIPFFLGKSGSVEADNSLNARGMNQAIIHAFISGLELAEMIFVHSKTALTLILSGCASVGRPVTAEKFIVAPPPKDPALADSHHQAYPPNRHIVYSHRLYAHYGTGALIQLLPFLLSLDTQVTVLDILGSRSVQRRSLDASPDIFREQLLRLPGVTVLEGGAQGDFYGEILRTAQIGLAPLRTNCTWSMACIDLMAIGKPVVAPAIAWFNEFIPAPLLYTDYQQARSITARLLNDASFYAEMSFLSYEKTQPLAPASIAHLFLAVFRNLIKKKVCSALKQS